MPKNTKKIDRAKSNQLSLFDLLAQQAQIYGSKEEPEPGSLAISQQVKQLLSNALKNTSYKRWEIAGRMGEYVGAEITESMLYSWTAESKEGHRFPLEYLPAFCWATGDYELVNAVVKACGGYFVKSEEAALLELARIEHAKQQLQNREKRVREYMKTMHQGREGLF